MKSILARKLEGFIGLSAFEKEALGQLASEHVRRYVPREDICRVGERHNGVKLILDGWACRYKDLEDGRRQILAVSLPGDLGDFNSWILARLDYSQCAITPVTAATLSRESLQRLTEQHPRLSMAFWWEGLVSSSIQREWTVNLGQRNASERLAHLFCEIYVRMRAIGQVVGNSFDFPLTQTDLGDATGLSVVHVNRTLQELRANGLVTLKEKSLTIPDFEALSVVADFNSDYLHLDREGRSLNGNE